MFRKEDFESWNQLFPDCKIQEADLNHPTEAFLIKTLVSFLRALGFKCDPPCKSPDGNENGQEKRRFLSCLAKQIDKIYKTTDKSYAFYPYDLIKPSPKKTSHLLGILLNYLFYYNMYKTNVFESVGSAIKEHLELKKSVETEEKYNHDLALKVQQSNGEIELLKQELPNMKNEFSRMVVELGKKQEISNEIKANIEENSKTFSFLEEEKFNLNEKLVPENQIRMVENDLETLRVDNDALKQQAEQYENLIKERKMELASMEQLYKEINKTKLIVPESLLNELKKSSQSLEEMRKEWRKVESQEKEINQSIAIIENSSDELTVQMRKEKTYLERQHCEAFVVIEELEKKLQEKANIIDELQRQHDEIEEKIILQNEMHEFMVDNAMCLLPEFNDDPTEK